MRKNCRSKSPFPPLGIHCHNNAHRWKYAISAGNFYFIRICSILQISQKMVTFECYKPGLSDCERMISVDYIINALEHFKVRLPFFIHPV